MEALKDKWSLGEPTLGLWAASGSALATEVLARAGLDYVCVDNQHGINDYSTTVSHLQAIDAGGCAPMVRVPWTEPGIIGKMLDAGAEGLIVPMVNSVAEAEAAVRACRYAPLGARSFGPVRAAERRPDYFAVANDLVTCIPMIETVQAVDALDDILGVSGVDAIYVGPADLAVSLGLSPSSADAEPAFREALAAIVAACRRNGVVAGIHATTAITEQRLEMGFQLVTVSSDTVAMRSGLADAIAVAGRVAAPNADGDPTESTADSVY